jgi:hypothetical protein
MTKQLKSARLQKLSANAMLNAGLCGQSKHTA